VRSSDDSNGSGRPGTGPRTTRSSGQATATVTVIRSPRTMSTSRTRTMPTGIWMADVGEAFRSPLKLGPLLGSSRWPQHSGPSPAPVTDPPTPRWNRSLRLRQRPRRHFSTLLPLPRKPSSLIFLHQRNRPDVPAARRPRPRRPRSVPPRPAPPANPHPDSTLGQREAQPWPVVQGTVGGRPYRRPTASRP
jgi:hypothetical protein